MKRIHSNQKNNAIVSFFIRKLMQVGLNAQIEINHVEVRYRDVCHDGERFSLCVGIENISLKTKDGKCDVPDAGYVYDPKNNNICEEYFDPSSETTLVKFLVFKRYIRKNNS